MVLQGVDRPNTTPIGQDRNFRVFFQIHFHNLPEMTQIGYPFINQDEMNKSLKRRNSKQTLKGTDRPAEPFSHLCYINMVT